MSLTLEKLLGWERELGITPESLAHSLLRLCAVAKDESRLRELGNQERDQVLKASAWIGAILAPAILVVGREQDKAQRERENTQREREAAALAWRPIKEKEFQTGECAFLAEPSYPGGPWAVQYCEWGGYSTGWIDPITGADRHITPTLYLVVPDPSDTTQPLADARPEEGR